MMDSDFADNHFPTDPNGNVYRGRRPDESPPGGKGAGLAYFGEDPAPYVSYVKNTNASEADWSDVVNLTRVLNLTPDAEYVDAVDAVADVDQWFRAFAMNQLMDNQENGLFTGDPLGDDYGMYRGLNETRFLMIPYDQDSLFNRTNNSIFAPSGNPALNRLITFPEFMPRYYAAFTDLIDNVLMTDAANQTIDEALKYVTSEAEIDSIKNFISARADFVRNQIQSQLTVDSNLSTQGGVPRSTVSSIVVNGQFPAAETFAVRVGDDLATLNVRQGTWRDSSTEQAADPLVPMGSTWRYLDDGSNQGTNWRQAGFDDSGWQSGRAQLGYGDGDELTQVGYGNNPNNRYVTTYFRTTFDVPDKDQIASLALRMLYDDGAAVYLNGTEIARANLVADATYSRLANSSRGQDTENLIENFTLSPSALDALVTGQNVLAVEIHQAAVDSPDIGLDLELGAVHVASDQFQLTPGMNRLPVTTYDNPAGTGEPLQSTNYDVWYDDGDEVLVSGQLNGNLNWTADQGPYRVQGDVVLAAGATLTIGPGTTVFFDQAASLTIHGQLTAEGAEAEPIWFTRRPGATSWNGLQFVNTSEDNRLDHVILEYGITDDGLVGLTNASLTVDNSWFDHTDRRRIRSQDSSLIVRNSTFTALFDFGQRPSTDNRSEHIWGGGIPTGGQWIIDGNTFGTLTGHNDAIDFDAPRGTGQFAQILNNEFLGGGDDALDMTGDIYIEGNVFHHFIKDQFNVDPGNSNTISASGGDFWVIRNVFDNIQHASLVKETAYMYFLNNTVVSSQFAPLYFDLPGQTSGPGKGALVQGSLFADSDTTFGQVLPSTDLQVSYSYLSAADADTITGVGNRFGDPHVAGAAGNFELLPGSLAEGSGPNGADMGARISAGVTLSGIPHGTTNGTTATIGVGGPGFTQYRYQLDGGPLTSPTAVDQPIQLDNLSAGTHQVAVIGQNALGEWQTIPTVSAAWTVDPSLPNTIRINEVLANNSGAFRLNGDFTDVIELYNFGVQPVNLNGYGLTDDLNQPYRFVFPVGAVIPPGEYLLVAADSQLTTPGLHAGFGLDQQGDEVYLFSPTNQMLDSVEFGQQLADLSIGRVGAEGQWQLTSPTLGSANLAHPVGDPQRAQINEWFAAGNIRLSYDFIELYNPDSYPINVGGLSVSDEPFAIPQKSTLSPLSFVDSDGFLVLLADSRPQDGKNHLAFQLDATHEHLGLMDSSGQFIDQVFYYPQTSEYSQGRQPDGSTEFAFSDLPTPGVSNGGETFDSTVLLSLDWNADWKYDASGQNLGTAWRQANYDDSSWRSGEGLLGNERGALPEPLRTSFPIGDITYYFRKTVTLDSVPDNMVTVFSTIVDDGFVVYVNGTEIQRVGMPDNTITASTTANRTVGQASVEGPFTVPNSAWVTGDNVIAVEVHQTNANSSDVVFGLQLTSSATVVIPEDNMPEQLLHGLRITELMYHPSISDGPEYVELQNTGDVDLDLTGVRLAGGIDFTFPAGTTLSAHEFIVVTEDVNAFRTTYGAAPRLAGEYSGRLSNGGEQIVLQFASPLDTAILNFAYHADWYPATDGGGSSLSVVDSALDFRRWSEAASWNVTPPSPGRETGAPIIGDINNDGIVDATDIDLLCVAINTNQTDMDLNGDGLINQADMSYLVHDILGTTVGDANLDRVFNSSDLVEIFILGEYEDNIAGNSGWADGDWDCDGDFTTSDMVAAFQEGGYVAAALPVSSGGAIPAAVAATPMDSTAALADIAAIDHSLIEWSDGSDDTTTDVGKVPSVSNTAPTLLTERIRRVDTAACDQVWETESYQPRRWRTDAAQIDDIADQPSWISMP